MDHGALMSFALQGVLFVVLHTLHRVCIDAGVNREIGANIENYKFRLHERILRAYIPYEARNDITLCPQQNCAHIYHNQGGRGDVPTGPLHISNIGHA